ncbi:MAG: hypothetical protein Q8L48_30960 [Archangium sp.]|nr:hypothetical protein [Archangium sp.]
MARLALDVVHGGRTQRIEFVSPRSLSFRQNGVVARNAHFGRGAHPEMLFIQWWRPNDPPAFHVTTERRPNPPKPETPRLNGVLRDRGTLSAGDVLRWRDFTVSVSPLKRLSAPEWGMVEAARQSDAALHVYADWLETSGASALAQWARLVLAPGDVNRAAQLSSLAPQLGPSLRALVARGPVERCGHKGCAARWEGLSLTEEPWVRNCGTCERPVSWCDDAETARAVQGPVVLDPATPRTPGDLLPRPVPVG